MKIEIEETEHGFKVSVGDRFQDHLWIDEALWCVVRILTEDPTKPRGYTALRTQAEHDEANALYGFLKKPLEDHQKLLPITACGKTHPEDPSDECTLPKGHEGTCNVCPF